MDLEKCKHIKLCLGASVRGRQTRYKAVPLEEKARAATTSKDAAAYREDCLAFPEPLVLMCDDLDFSAGNPQCVQEWESASYRNRISEARKTIYVVDAPSFAPEMEFVGIGMQPARVTPSLEPAQINTQAVVDYVAAFYHGLPAKLLPSSTFQFVSWEDDGPPPAKRTRTTKRKTPERIGIQTTTAKFGIRVRPSRDNRFSMQLNLNDLLDVAIDALPSDAYAMVMLTHHDLYEDEWDEFVCGRAYGGSRVAVVSTARYNPLLDSSVYGLDTHHAWPNSHCANFMVARNAAHMWRPKAKVKLPPNTKTISSHDQQSPLAAASQAVKLYYKSGPESVADTWLGRVCRTVSHELGHCFGIDHCVYYACCMQGSGRLDEDIRQPPYLCPVDQAKVLHATGATQEDSYKAMLHVCEKYADVELFTAYAAWIRTRLEQGLSTGRVLSRRAHQK